MLLWLHLFLPQLLLLLLLRMPPYQLQSRVLRCPSVLPLFMMRPGIAIDFLFLCVLLLVKELQAQLVFLTGMYLLSFYV